LLANGEAKEWQMEQQAIVRFLSLKCLKAKEIEMELVSTYGDEALQISAVKNGERVSCRGEQNSEMAHDRESQPILI
jgi:hypothetical protein